MKKQILTMKGAETNTWNVPLLELPQGKISEGNDRGNGRRSSYFFSSKPLKRHSQPART
ncbi:MULTISPECIES: hypothetical protein [Bacteroides]|jgi:hypothetical protein|uniref:hypothetical protein n=1 Tax=Bacteroides TaxID=816 RepID=UPI001B8B9FD0|nr:MULTISPECIES: hypothetical protein [Bacteroides]